MIISESGVLSDDLTNQSDDGSETSGVSEMSKISIRSTQSEKPHRKLRFVKT